MLSFLKRLFKIPFEGIGYINKSYEFFFYKVLPLSIIVFFSGLPQDALAIVTSESKYQIVNVSNSKYPIPKLLKTLSELKLFKGVLTDLIPASNVMEYELSTPLFTDYAHKLRLISLPENGQMVYKDSGLPIFPDNTILAKTFYYFNDERNPDLGKKIIETRVLIKKAGRWVVGEYIWNHDQTEAFLKTNAETVDVEWINESGKKQYVRYKTPSNKECVKCHSFYGKNMPIGPKLRNMNFEFDKTNQLKKFIKKGMLTGAPKVKKIQVIPHWLDASVSLKERTKAYLDVNCAHCHRPGGFHGGSSGGRFDFRYETEISNVKFKTQKDGLYGRMATRIDGYSMPLIGSSKVHAEGVQLIEDFIKSLE